MWACGGQTWPNPDKTGSLKWEREILSKKETAEKWLYSFQHPRCEFLYWVIIIFQKFWALYFRLSAQHLPPFPQAVHFSRCLVVQLGSGGCMGVGLPWLHIICHPQPPSPWSFGCTSTQLSFKNFFPVLALPHCPDKIFPTPLSLYSHLCRVFAFIKCFPLQLFTWSSWYPWWGSSDGIITPILQERRLRLSSGFYSVIRDYLRVSASHWSSSAPLAQVPGFLSLFSLSHS